MHFARELLLPTDCCLNGAGPVPEADAGRLRDPVVAGYEGWPPTHPPKGWALHNAHFRSDPFCERFKLLLRDGDKHPVRAGQVAFLRLGSIAAPARGPTGGPVGSPVGGVGRLAPARRSAAARGSIAAQANERLGGIGAAYRFYDRLAGDLQSPGKGGGPSGLQVSIGPERAAPTAAGSILGSALSPGSRRLAAHVISTELVV
ncbi:hypothetical protein GGQ18_002881 [Salinibacter ruber]|nr:hypothetical protein [Salinibacter ruber]